MEKAETRLRASIDAADSHIGFRGSVEGFVDETGASLRFVNGTYVLQHLGIRISSTWKSPSMVENWQSKALVKLAENFRPPETSSERRRRTEGLEL